MSSVMSKEKVVVYIDGDVMPSSDNFTLCISISIVCGDLKYQASHNKLIRTLSGAFTARFILKCVSGVDSDSWYSYTQ